jgi:tRNA-specific 2-thiouridylase
MARPKPKVLVAMSGGVDSSVAAALLLRDGYDVVGCFMRLGSPGESFDELIDDNKPSSTDRTIDAASDEPATCSTRRASAILGEQDGDSSTRPSLHVLSRTPIKIGHQGCCSINDAADARLVAAKLGIPFYVCNFKKDFGRIIDYFVSEYNAGRTPNPCVRCNDWLKFGKLHEYALQIDAQFVASGHYARIAPVPNHTGSADPRLRLRLLRGIDHTKDQSYVLFGAPRERLAEMLLPIGGLQKAYVRQLAKEFDLPVFDKPDSQEICFVPDNDYAGLVRQRTPELVNSGAVLDQHGRVIGEHPGHQHFTIGQRKGVGVALGHPVYVVNKNPQANTITLGEKDDLRVHQVVANQANWLVEVPALDEAVPCTAKFRYNSPPVDAVLRRTGDDELQVDFTQPQHGVAPGQAVVCYDGDAVLGGGWISHTN